MKKVYRDIDIVSYWEKRWREAGEDKDYFDNLEIYPIKYAMQTIKDKNGVILECGCGLGRVLKHYHLKGHKIIGLEYDQGAVDKIKKQYPDINVMQGDVRKLPFKNETFDYIVSFGLYHNIENDVQGTINETVRCLKKGGRFCATVRADNFENTIGDLIVAFKTKNKKKDKFYKWSFKPKEFKKMVEDSGVKVESVQVVTNMPFLFKIKIFRKKELQKIDKSTSLIEPTARSEGFKLNKVGNFIYKTLTTLFPNSFGNVVVVIGEKN